MGKFYRLVVGLLMVGLLGGGYATTVDASASAGPSAPNLEVKEEQSDDAYHSAEDRWITILQQYFGKWNNQSSEPEEVEEDVSEDNQDNVAEDEQPEVEETEQPNVNVDDNTEVEEKPSNNEANDLHEFEQRVYELTNEEREKHGLAPLEIDIKLSKVSRDKSQDMLDNQYFSHDSPTYGSPFDMMKAYGIEYQAAGENIAKGQNTPEEVVNAWMNSQGHRENILNSSFTHIGVGYVEQQNVWTQQFIGK